MSSSKTNVQVELLFNDATTRVITFEEVAQEDLAAIKSKVKAINANANNEYANFYETFISDDGESVIKINSCKIITYEEEIIYSGE